MKKLITIFILYSLIAPQLLLAQVGVVTDPGNTAVNSANTAQQTVGTAQQILLTVKETVLDGLAFQLAQTTGAKLANKVFNKANGGASGDDSQPSYVQDFNNYFADLDRSKLQKYITDLEVSKNPFAQNIARSMVLAYSQPVVQGYQTNLAVLIWILCLVQTINGFMMMLVLVVMMVFLL